MSSKTIIRTALGRFMSCSNLSFTQLEGRPRYFSTRPYFADQSQYRKQISIASIFQKYGLPSSQLQRFINANRYLLHSNLLDIEESFSILLSFKMPQRNFVSLISECPGVLELDFLRNWKIGFSKCGDLSVSPLMIKSVLAHSRRSQTNPDGFNKSLNDLRGLGISNDTITRIFENFPEVITMKQSEIHYKIRFLMKIGISRDEVDWILNSYTVVLGYGVRNRLMPLINEFEELGFSRELVIREIIREPQVLGLESGELSRCMDLINSLKCREPIKLKIFCNGAFRAGFQVKQRVDTLCKHGLIRREAFKILWKEPRVIIYDVEEIEEKIEFLLNTMRFNVSCLVEVPEYLGVSLEKQIVPRYNVIEYLNSKGGLGDVVSLKGIIKLSRRKFYNLYVKPYPECEKMFGRIADKVEVKRKHPVGLWKMFKPPLHPDSKEDMNIMKSFMEGLA